MEGPEGLMVGGIVGLCTYDGTNGWWGESMYESKYHVDRFRGEWLVWSV